MIGAGFLAIAVAVVAFGVFVAGAFVIAGEASHASGMDAMSLDMAVAGNSATSLGARQDCVQLSPGASAAIDVTANEIPGANPMRGYTYRLTYPSAALTIASQDSEYLLGANSGSVLLNSSEPLPDNDLNDDWNATVVDTGLGTLETGSGVLDRLTVQVDPGATTGLYSLTLTNNGHIGPDSLTATSDTTYHAAIAVGVSCDSDGDGWNDVTEGVIGTSAQQNCGADGWPAELKVSGDPGTSTLDIADIASFVAPIDRLNTSLGDPAYSARWDLAPGSTFGEHINLTDMSALVAGSTGFPPMFGGEKAFGHDRCTVVVPTPSPTGTATATSTATATPTRSPTTSPTPAPTPSPTASPTPSPSPLPTPTRTPTATPSGSPSPSPSPTPTLTPTATPSASPSPSPTPTRTPTPTPTPGTTTSPTPGTLTVQPMDDAYVAGDNPGGNFGQALDLQADGNPARESYLKFDLQPLAGRPVWQAKLRMFVSDASGNTENVKAVSNDNWTELAITYNNRPAKGSIVSTFVPSSGGWVEADLTSYVAENVGSVVSIAIDATGGNSYGFNSAEAGANRVELVVNHGTTPTPTAPPTPSPTPTPTPTPSPSPTAGPPTPTPTPTPTPGPQTPTPPPGAAFSFGVAADLGESSNTEAVLDAVDAAGLNFFLAGGDLSYSGSGSETSWCNLVKSHVGSTYPFELVSGNHEDDGPDGLITNFAACLPHRLTPLTGTYAKEFYFDYPPSGPTARFINISPDLSFPGQGTWDYSTGSSHHIWTANAIDSARAAGIKWVIVSMHKYCISMTSAGGCEVGSDLMNLLVDKKVDLYFQAHDHAYARSKQLAHRTGRTTMPDGSFDADCVVDATAPFVAGAGTVIMTAGMGGQSINSVDTGDSEKGYFATWMGSNANPTYGFLKVTVTATSLSAQFVRGAGGSYGDSFTIQ